MTRQEKAIVKAAVAWFNNLKPLAWTQEKHIHNPRCNTTTDAAEKLAVAVGAHLRRLGGRPSQFDKHSPALPIHALKAAEAADAAHTNGRMLSASRYEVIYYAIRDALLSHVEAQADTADRVGLDTPRAASSAIPPAASAPSSKATMPDGSRITHRWSGAYHDRLEYFLDGRLLSMEEVKGLLHHAVSADRSATVPPTVSVRFMDGALWLDWREGLLNLTHFVGRNSESARKDMAKIMAASDGSHHG